MKKYAVVAGMLSIALAVNILLVSCSSSSTTTKTTKPTGTEPATTTETTTTTVPITTTATTSIMTSPTATPVTNTTVNTNSNWTLSLVGEINQSVNQSLFAQGAAPGCHFSIWTDAQGHVWQGIALWLLAAYVDDSNLMGPPNMALWNQGFGVQVFAADGSFVEYTSAEIKNNENIFVAYHVDGKSLSSTQWPLALAGSAVD